MKKNIMKNAIRERIEDDLVTHDEEEDKNKKHVHF